MYAHLSIFLFSLAKLWLLNFENMLCKNLYSHWYCLLFLNISLPQAWFTTWIKAIKNVAKHAHVCSILMHFSQDSIPESLVKKNSKWQSYSTLVESDCSYIPVHGFNKDIFSEVRTMAIPVVEFSTQGYKIRKNFA